jgi:hypothetical protein
MKKIFNYYFLTEREFLIKQLQVLSGFFFILSISLTSFTLLLFLGLSVILIFFFIKDINLLKKKKENQEEKLFEQYYQRQKTIFFENVKIKEIFIKDLFLVRDKEELKINIVKDFEKSLYNKKYFFIKILFTVFLFLLYKPLSLNGFKNEYTKIASIFFFINSLLIFILSFVFQENKFLKKIIISLQLVFFIITFLSIVIISDLFGLVVDLIINTHIMFYKKFLMIFTSFFLFSIISFYIFYIFVYSRLINVDNHINTSLQNKTNLDINNTFMVKNIFLEIIFSFLYFLIEFFFFIVFLYFLLFMINLFIAILS